MTPEALLALMVRLDKHVQRIYLSPRDAIECIRTHHPRQEVETTRELLLRGLLGYLAGASIYSRRFIPDGYCAMLGDQDSNDDLREGWLPTTEQLVKVVEGSPGDPSDEGHARNVKEFIKTRLGRPPWFLATTIVYDKPEGRYVLEVHVTDDHPDELVDLVPDQHEGVPIRIVTKQEQPHNAEARNVARFIHEQWPFITEQEAFDFYWGLGHIAISEGSVKTSLWVLKRVLDQQNPVKHKVGDVWEHFVGDMDPDPVYAPMTVVKVNEDGSLRMSDGLDWEEDELEDGWRKKEF